MLSIYVENAVIFLEIVLVYTNQAFHVVSLEILYTLLVDMMARLVVPNMLTIKTHIQLYIIFLTPASRVKFVS